MLQLSASLTGKSVLSLRTNGVVAKVVGTLINPDNLKIEGFYCEDRFNKNTLVLLWQDIRDSDANGYFVNDHEVMADSAELVRFKKIIDIKFDPIGKQVVTVSKKKIGKVSDFAYDNSTMYIHKLYVSQSVLKSFTGGSLSVDRTQIQEITPKQIVIQELANKNRLGATAPVPNTL